jgi:membrane protease YdiL (CAAX protease family)
MTSFLLLLRALGAPALVALAYWQGAAHGPVPAIAGAALGLLLFGAAAAARDTAIVCFLLAGGLMLALALNLVPGWHRVALWGASIHTAKAFAGLAAMLVFPSALRWNARASIVAVLTLVAVPALAWWLHQVHWAPAGLHLLGAFAIANFFSSLAEEWFFRRWVQQPLAGVVGQVLALVGAAALFGLVHYSQGHTYMALAALAGLGYGAVFWLTGGSIWAAVALHWALNLLRVAMFGM